MRYHIIMLGTSPKARGGISSVIETYFENKIFDRWAVCYIQTHADGNIKEKLFIFLHAIFEFLKTIISNDILLVHVHTASRSSFFRKSFFFILCKIFRLPYVIHLHGAEFLKFYNDECSFLTKRLIANIFTSAKSVAVLSETWATAIRGLFRNVDVRVVSNPVRFLQLYPTERHGNSILFSGRMDKRKGIFDLLTAFASVSALFPKARLFCCGDGAIEEVRRRVELLGLSSTVVIHGWVGRDCLQQILAASDIFVLPSYDEGLPMSLLEAMSASLAIVTTPVGGIPEVITDHVNGILVSPGDSEALACALIEILESEQIRMKFAAAAYKTVTQTFSTKNALHKLDDLYLSLGLKQF